MAKAPGIEHSGKVAADEVAEQDSTVVAALVTAARACFARYGVGRTRIEDVASAASVSRATFYRYFKTREELIDAVVLAQLQEAVQRYGPEIQRARTLESALVRGSVNLLMACHSDEVFMELLWRARGERLSDLARGASRFFQPVAEGLWMPALEAAVARGELRGGAELGEIVSWISSVHLLLLLREPLEEADIERTMKRFVAPALVAG